MKQIYLILGMLIWANLPLAQENLMLKEFKELNAHYDGLTAFSMDFEIQYYDLNGKLKMRQTGAVVHSPDVHYSKVGERISLLTDKQYISVNPEGRFIIYNELQESAEPAESDEMDINVMLDSLWASQKNLKYSIIPSENETMRVFIEDSKNDFFEAYEMLINTTKNQLLEFSYYGKAQAGKSQFGKIRIAYSNETSRPKLGAKHLKTDYYLKKRDKKRMVSERYADYELFDQTKTLPDYD